MFKQTYESMTPKKIIPYNLTNKTRDDYFRINDSKLYEIIMDYMPVDFVKFYKDMGPEINIKDSEYTITFKQEDWNKIKENLERIFSQVEQIKIHTFYSYGNIDELHYHFLIKKSDKPMSIEIIEIKED